MTRNTLQHESHNTMKGVDDHISQYDDFFTVPRKPRFSWEENDESLVTRLHITTNNGYAHHNTTIGVCSEESA